jgi:hypothetical protein
LDGGGLISKSLAGSGEEGEGDGGERLHFGVCLKV